MFVLPPPPRYPNQMLYNGGYLSTAGGVIPETNNTLSHPSGPDCEFTVGEGVYVLLHEIKLVLPPIHPTLGQPTTTNPLSTDPRPPKAGTKVSLVDIAEPTYPQALENLIAAAKEERAYNAGVAAAEAAEKLAAMHLSHDGADLEASPSTASHAAHAAPPVASVASVASPGEVAVADPSAGRLSFNTASARSAGSDAGAGVPATNPFTANNIGTPAPTSGGAFSFAGVGAGRTAAKQRKKPKGNVVKSNSSFLSRGVGYENLQTRLIEHEEADGFLFANRDRGFHWLDRGTAKPADYLTKVLLAKAHCLCHDVNQVTKSATNLDVLMGCSTGDIIWYEAVSGRYARINKNGVIRNSYVTDIHWMPGSETLFMASFANGAMVIFDREKEDVDFVYDEAESNRRRLANPAAARAQIEIVRSVHSAPSKVNPFAFWKISNSMINGFAFSPEGQTLVAVVSEDGSIRVIDYLSEELLVVHKSLYSGTTCVCWSPDGKYFVTGSQDDFLSIWSVNGKQVTFIARCQGHGSWPTCIAFDPWRCDERVYRFASVGEDCRLCLWDFSLDLLNWPKEAAPADDDDTIVHKAVPHRYAAVLKPVLAKIVHNDVVSGVAFTKSAIITSSNDGTIRNWSRPGNSGDSTEPQSDT